MQRDAVIYEECCDTECQREEDQQPLGLCLFLHRYEAAPGWHPRDMFVLSQVSASVLLKNATIWHVTTNITNAGLLWHDTGRPGGGKERPALVQNTAQAVRPVVQAQGVRARIQDPTGTAQVRHLSGSLQHLCQLGCVHVIMIKNVAANAKEYPHAGPKIVARRYCPRSCKVLFH